MNLRLSLERAWYRPMSWALLLLPLSWLFRAVSSGRRFYYRRIKPPCPLPIPVIVVGNISVGGTGKTPLLAALVVIFQAQGYRPGIISRGYGGSATHYPQRVTDTSTADNVGDEPLLLSSLCPVVVDPDRYRAARYLLEKTGCNLIFSDDGLQHYRLPRNIEIVVMDGERVGGLLHGTELRRALDALERCDFKTTRPTREQLDVPKAVAMIEKLIAMREHRRRLREAIAVIQWFARGTLFRLHHLKLINAALRAQPFVRGCIWRQRVATLHRVLPSFQRKCGAFHYQRKFNSKWAACRHAQTNY